MVVIVWAWRFKCFGKLSKNLQVKSDRCSKLVAGGEITEEIPQDGWSSQAIYVADEEFPAVFSWFESRDLAIGCYLIAKGPPKPFPLNPKALTPKP